MPFYHGSASVLGAGDILYPGEAVGLSWHGRSQHVYMTHDSFSMSEVDYTPPSIRNASQFAVYSALLWGCFAADAQCQDECQWGLDHTNAIRQGFIPECVRVYEVSPLGPVTADDAHDVDPDACRTTEAKIVRILGENEIQTILDW